MKETNTKQPHQLRITYIQHIKLRKRIKFTAILDS